MVLQPCSNALKGVVVI